METLLLVVGLAALAIAALLLRSGTNPRMEAEHGEPEWLRQAQHTAVRDYVAARWREDGRTDLALRIQDDPDEEVLNLANHTINAVFANVFATQNPQARANMLAQYEQRNGGNKLLAMLELIVERAEDEQRFR